MKRRTIFSALGALMLLVLLAGSTSVSGCYETSSDDVQTAQQETILKEGTAAVGMPAIKNFRERRLVKMLLEMRDQEDLITYTYLVAEMSGKLVFFGKTVGYGIPYATQFTNPEKAEGAYSAPYTIPQADPNGLFSPSSAEGTWVFLLNPKNPSEVRPVYVEPRIVVSAFPLH